jgi:hypothetical protein
MPDLLFSSSDASALEDENFLYFFCERFLQAILKFKNKGKLENQIVWSVIIHTNEKAFNCEYFVYMFEGDSKKTKI